MDDPRHERRHHFRGKPKPGRVLVVRFRAPAHTAWVTAETRDVGTGGAFIATTEAAPAGTTLTVELALPTTDQVFVLSAVVRWATPHGMGVQFVDVEVEVLLELNDYFGSLT